MRTLLDFLSDVFQFLSFLIFAIVARVLKAVFEHNSYDDFSVRSLSIRSTARLLQETVSLNSFFQLAYRNVLVGSNSRRLTIHQKQSNQGRSKLVVGRTERTENMVSDKNDPENRTSHYAFHTRTNQQIQDNVSH